jgi:hypothetical protein
MVPTFAYVNYGKFLEKWVLMTISQMRESVNRCVFTGLDVGLGGLEPPTSP